MAGIGAASHLGGLMLNSMMKVDVLEIPYKGTGPALNDLVSGQFDYMVDQAVNVLPQIQSGNIKALGVSTTKRLPQLPNVPTIDEAGLKGYEVTIWNGFFAPKGTPKDIIDKLNQALVAATNDEKVRVRLTDLAVELPTAQEATPEALPRPAQGLDRQVGACRAGRRRQAGVNSRSRRTPEGFNALGRFSFETVSAGRSERRRVGRSQTCCGCDGGACGSSGPTADRPVPSRDWSAISSARWGAASVPLFDCAKA